MNYLLQPIHLTPLEWALFIAAGILTGVINTLAGSGSLITLPLLMYVGMLPAPIANATNRVGVLIQGIVGIYGLNKAGKMHWKGVYWILIPMFLGGVTGATLAVEMNELAMKISIGSLMLVMMVLLLVKPERWIKNADANQPIRKNPWHLPVFFALGVYGGFIQAGVGMFMLAVFVLMAGLDLIQSNGIKLLAITVLNVPAFFIFLYNGQIHLGLGLLLAGSQVLGAWAAVKWIGKQPSAQVWTYRLLLLVVMFSGARIAWDIWTYLAAR